MKARGHAVTTIAPDGTRLVTWVPANAAPQSERSTAVSSRSAHKRPPFEPTTVEALARLGRLMQFNPSHWQVRRGSRVVLDLWTRKKGPPLSWRFPNGETFRGNDAALRKALDASAE